MNEGERQRAYHRAVFGTVCATNEQIKTALKQAHEIRQFEIRLYWQRSLFFWGFILTFLGGFTVLKQDKNPEIDVLLTLVALSLLGHFTSFAWCKLEVGSRSWQRNWEYHIDFLENDAVGKVHKTILGNRKEFFSVSKILHTFIWALKIFWVVMIVISVCKIINEIYCNLGMTQLYSTCFLLLFIFLIFGIVLCLFWLKCKLTKYWRTRKETMPNKISLGNNINVYQRELPGAKFSSVKKKKCK